MRIQTPLIPNNHDLTPIQVWGLYQSEYFNPTPTKYSAPEVWKRNAMPGVDTLYMVSSWGRVKKLKKESLLVPLRHTRDAGQHFYARVSVKTSENGKMKKVYIHHLIAWSFNGPRGLNEQVCHYNDCKLDNRAENIHWGTAERNALDWKFNNPKNKAAVVVGSHSKPDMTFAPEQELELLNDPILPDQKLIQSVKKAKRAAKRLKENRLCQKAA